MASERCGRATVLLLLLFAMAATLVALVTDHWYDVAMDGRLVTPQEKRENTYRFGLWRRCYDNRPDPFPLPDVDESGDDCIWIYKDLIPDNEDDMSSDEKMRLHLMRSTLGLSITSVVCLLGAFISLICAWLPGDSPTPRKAMIYMVALVIVLIAVMAAIGSGICFMAARDVEDKDLKMYPDMNTEYLWSFMLHWIGTGLMFLTGCQLLYLLAHSYNDVTNKSLYYYSY